MECKTYKSVVNIYAAKIVKIFKFNKIILEKTNFVVFIVIKSIAKIATLMKLFLSLVEIPALLIASAVS